MQRIASRLASIAALALVVSPAIAADEKAAAPAVDPAVVELVRRAGDHLRAAERFSFQADTRYGVVQEDAFELEFGATRHYLVKRPDRVRVEVQPRSGNDRLIVFDGDHLTVAEPRAKLYAQLRFDQHREIDEALVLLREMLGVPIPLGELLRSDPRPDLVGSLTEAFHVGTAKLAGTECDHVALRNPDADLQLWIARGDAPLLQRVVITYRNEEGAPSFAADFRDWSLDANAPDEQFRYDPPADFERIRFSVPARPEDAAGKPAPEAP
ncbi:MAG: hypothetical protein DCC71_01890 [Proteobacteria bacterium]|nr:MAG: hypothetical protein DCC71_01890 [Pseudomonadota bacterium]